MSVICNLLWYAKKKENKTEHMLDYILPYILQWIVFSFHLDICQQCPDIDHRYLLFSVLIENTKKTASTQLLIYTRLNVVGLFY